VDKIIEVPQTQEIVKHVPKVEVVDVPVQRVVHVPKVEVQTVEQVRHVPVPEVIDVEVEVVTHVPVPVPQIQTVERQIPVPEYIDQEVDVPVPAVQHIEVPVDVPVDQIIHREVPRIVEVPKFIDVPVPVEVEQVEYVHRQVPMPGPPPMQMPMPMLPPMYGGMGQPMPSVPSAAVRTTMSKPVEVGAEAMEDAQPTVVRRASGTLSGSVSMPRLGLGASQSMAAMPTYGGMGPMALPPMGFHGLHDPMHPMNEPLSPKSTLRASGNPFSSHLM